MSRLRTILGVLLPSLILAAGLPACTCFGPAGQSSPPALSRTGTTSPAHLKSEIDTILARELLPAAGVGIKVVSLKEGETLYEFNSHLLLNPASTQKIYTAAAALSLLGPDREVTTTVALDAAAARIYLKGCGDTLLSVADLSRLAGEAASTMDSAKEYTLAADVSCFDDLYRGKGWMWDDDEILISPLSVNQNSVSLLVHPAPRAGAPPTITAEPVTSYFTLENLATTGPADEPSTIQAYRRPDERENRIVVSGVIPVGSPTQVKQASIWRPELMALTLFRDALRARGVNVTNLITAPVPVGATQAAHLSRRVGDLVRFALKTSDNPTAESLLKLMGLQFTDNSGSGDAGSAAVRRFLKSRGIPTDNLSVADGSGLSRYNLSSAESMTRLLDAMYRDRRLFDTFRDSLPVAGVDGTLKGRMKGSCAEGNLRGKTGNMSGVSALAGYLDTADGEPLAFAILVQNFAGSGRHAREVQDRIATLLCGFRRTR